MNKPILDNAKAAEALRRLAISKEAPRRFRKPGRFSMYGAQDRPLVCRDHKCYLPEPGRGAIVFRATGGGSLEWRTHG